MRTLTEIHPSGCILSKGFASIGVSRLEDLQFPDVPSAASYKQVAKSDAGPVSIPERGNLQPKGVLQIDCWNKHGLGEHSPQRLQVVFRCK